MEGESIEMGARRELKEEADIDVVEMCKVGILDFEFESDPKILEVHIFRVSDFTGEPQESEEMKPERFHVDQIPFDQMWSDDIYWMPLLLAGKKFKGRFVFDRPSDATYSAKIISQELFEVEEV